MEPTEETDDAVERRYNELCLDLNMDKGTKEEAWESYQKIKQNTHWREIRCTGLLVHCTKHAGKVSLQP